MTELSAPAPPADLWEPLRRFLADCDNEWQPNNPPCLDDLFALVDLLRRQLAVVNDGAQVLDSRGRPCRAVSSTRPAYRVNGEIVWPDGTGWSVGDPLDVLVLVPEDGDV